MNASPPPQEFYPSGAVPILSGFHGARPRPLAILGGYWVAHALLQLAGGPFLSPQGASLWFLPAGLSVALLLFLGPRYLPAVLLAPLPVSLLVRPMGLPPGTLLALSVIFGCSHGLAVMAFRAARLSPRLRGFRDVTGFLALGLLGPALAAYPLFLCLRASGAVAPGHLPATLRALLLGDALGLVTLGPALLLWLRPLVVLGRGGWPRKAAPFPPKVLLTQALGLVLTVLAVVGFSPRGSLSWQPLLFLPLCWVALRGGRRGVSLALPLLWGLVALALAWVGPAPIALMASQPFLLILLGSALYLGTAVDVHEAALAKRDRSIHRLNQLVESTGAIPWEMDLETGRCGHLGLQVVPLFGWPLEDWRHRPFWGKVVHPDDHRAFLSFLRNLCEPGGQGQLEFRLRTQDGEGHWVRVVGGLDPGPGQGLVIGFLFDIHAHKLAEEQALRASLKEKDLLLREIHHRVKNNLQVVSSLLRLQAATQLDPAVQRALQEAQDRIQAIALVHQKLKHAPDFSHLDLPTYVQGLAERLVRSQAAAPSRMDLQVRVAEVAISPDALVPLGLILNELITNALQHAFPAGEGGRLEVTIGEDEKGWITVQVADTGRGLPEGLDLEQGGLGFQLVKALTDQLGGTLALGQHPGASFFLAFPPGLPPP